MTVYHYCSNTTVIVTVLITPHMNTRKIHHTSMFINVFSSSEIFLSLIRMDSSCSCTLFCKLTISAPDFWSLLGVRWVSVGLLLSKIFSPLGSWYKLIIWIVKRGRNLLQMCVCLIEQQLNSFPNSTCNYHWLASSHTGTHALYINGESLQAKCALYFCKVVKEHMKPNKSRDLLLHMCSSQWSRYQEIQLKIFSYLAWTVPLE